MLRTSSKQHQLLGIIDKNGEEVQKCQATQTDILDEVTEEEEYDYVYRYKLRLIQVVVINFIIVTLTLLL